MWREYLMKRYETARNGVGQGLHTTTWQSAGWQSAGWQSAASTVIVNRNVVRMKDVKSQ